MATGRRAEKKEETRRIQGRGESVTEPLAWRSKQKGGGRIRKGRKEKRRKEKGEDEGGGKSVKPVTEWAGMTDWVVAVRTWIPGKGQEVGGNQEPSGPE